MTVRTPRWMFLETKKMLCVKRDQKQKKTEVGSENVCSLLVPADILGKCFNGNDAAFVAFVA